MPKCTSSKQILQLVRDEDISAQKVLLRVISWFEEANDTTTFQCLTGDKKRIRLTIFCDPSYRLRRDIFKAVKRPLLRCRIFHPSSSYTDQLAKSKNVVHFENVKIIKSALSMNATSDMEYSIRYDQQSRCYRGRKPIPRLIDLARRFKEPFVEFKQLKSVYLRDRKSTVAIYGVLQNSPGIEETKGGPFLVLKVSNARGLHLMVYLQPDLKPKRPLAPGTELIVRGTMYPRKMSNDHILSFFVEQAANVTILPVRLLADGMKKTRPITM